MSRLRLAARAFAAAGCLALTAGCSAPQDGEPTRTSRVEDRVIYGSDDRVEYYDLTDPRLKSVADATVALVDESYVSEAMDGTVSLPPDTYGELDDLCPGEAFADEPSVAQCSGVLIAKDLVLTADHCLREKPCEKWRAIFGFQYDAPGRLRQLGASDVYSCSRVVARDYTWAPEGGADYAVIALDRDVEPARAASIPPVYAGILRQGQQIVSVGHGAGLPVKVDPAGRVADPRSAAAGYFVASLDTFHGDSGAGVYDAESRLVGVLAGGNDDYDEGPDGCQRARVLAPSASAERVTYAARAIEAMCAVDQAKELRCPTQASASCSLTRPGSGQASTTGYVGLLIAVWSVGRRLRRTSSRRAA